MSKFVGDRREAYAIMRQLRVSPQVRLALDTDPVWLATYHAPKGGITLAGKQFVGGEFIPSEVAANATGEDRAKLKVKRTLREHAARLPLAILKATSREGVADAVRMATTAVQHPVQTAGAALDAGKAKLAGIYRDYGPVGATAIASAYVVYHALAAANPVLYPIFGSGVGTIQTAAALVKAGIEKVRG